MKRSLWGLTALLAIALVRGGEPAKGPVLVVKPEAFQTLVNPQCSHCRDEAKRRARDLRSGDQVLCWIRDTKGKYDGGAIPYRFFLNPYRVISDTYGVFVYDPDAGYARGFAPSLDFRFHGWRNGVMVMKHKDGTLYSCLTGVAFAGPKKGTRLQAVPTLVSNWGDWLRRYPGSVAYHMFEKYQPVELPTAVNASSRKSRSRPDKRIPADSRILGVREGKFARAYPLEVLAKKGLIHDRLDGQPVVVLWNGPTQTAAAYRPIAVPPSGEDASPRIVTLHREAKKGSAPFRDKESGSKWDIAGRAVAGKLKGWTLHWLDGTQVKWFAWTAEFPATSIYGK
jgi:hypothetical protein